MEIKKELGNKKTITLRSHGCTRSGVVVVVVVVEIERERERAVGKINATENQDDNVIHQLNPRA